MKRMKQEIASVRIHVERAIERVKNCNVIKQILPNSMSEDIDKNLCELFTGQF